MDAPPPPLAHHPWHGDLRRRTQAFRNIVVPTPRQGKLPTSLRSRCPTELALKHPSTTANLQSPIRPGPRAGRRLRR